jgi:hypothetical protein
VASAFIQILSYRNEFQGSSIRVESSMPIQLPIPRVELQPMQLVLVLQIFTLTLNAQAHHCSMAALGQNRKLLLPLAMIAFVSVQMRHLGLPRSH